MNNEKRRRIKRRMIRTMIFTNQHSHMHAPLNSFAPHSFVLFAFIYDTRHEFKFKSKFEFKFKFEFVFGKPSISHWLFPEYEPCSGKGRSRGVGGDGT